MKVEGGLLPGDFLRKLAQGDSSIPGLDAASYHVEGARLHDAIAASWNAMRSRWANLRTALEGLPVSDTATSLTRERFLLSLFAELQYGRLVPEKAREIDGSEYPISHYWRNSPIHLLGFRVPLDRRSPGVQGAARTSPHSLIQDYLNRTEAALWGFLSNGQVLRILRDNKTMARPSFVEFDLVTMFETEAYSDFVILWLLCHQSRVESEDPYKCHLEQWVTVAQERGTRALDKLRHGVATALNELGQGFLEQTSNAELHRALKEGAITNLEYYRQIIRVVYRLMFLLAGEDRDLLFARDCNSASKSNYLRFYSASRLREMAAKVYGTRHGDLWESLKTTFGKLSDEGCADLALPALNSFLWDPRATSALNTATLSNNSLLNAVRNLTYITEGASRQRIDYKNIGAEEIGGIYENIIAFSPLLDVETFTFSLGEGAFSERDETASHYTPTSLVDELLTSALDPVLDRAETQKDPASAILALKVCDRACGSGHFLVAAAKRIAKRLASVRSSEAEPAPDEIQKALRDVIAHCIYGVDLNPTAVELCKFSLWLESMDCGRPLSFLENRIKTGNALLGATPAALTGGLPDEAFGFLKGDDKTVVSALKKQNKRERADIEQGQHQLFSVAEVLWTAWIEVKNGAERIIAIDDDAIERIHKKQAEYESLLVSDSYLNQKLVADAWCAAFVLPRNKGAVAITAAAFGEIRNDPNQCPNDIRSQINLIAAEYAFFHWHLEFPEVFDLPRGLEVENAICGWSGGFDVNLGNPPWDRVKLQEKKWFSERVPQIAKAPNAGKRKALIRALKEEQPFLSAQFEAAKRRADGASHLLRNSGLYPLCGCGDINVYAVFAEANRSHLKRTGVMGIVVPTNIATDDTTKYFFQDVVDTGSLLSLYDFENGQIFPGVDSRFKFCLFTCTSGKVPHGHPTTFVFFAQATEDVHDSDRRVTLTPEDIKLLNPSTRTCAVFRSKKDAEITKAIYRNAVTLSSVIPPIRFFPKIDMSDEIESFVRLDELDESIPRRASVFYDGENYVRLYESKLIWHYDHRFGTFEGCSSEEIDAGNNLNPENSKKTDPFGISLPRYYVPQSLVQERYNFKRGRPDFLFGVRRLTNATNERTAVFCVVPYSGCGNSMFVFDLTSVNQAVWLLACGNSFIFDYVARNKLSGTNFLQFIIEQLPVPDPNRFGLPCPWVSTADNPSSDVETSMLWITSRVLELTYTAWDIQPFATALGVQTPPFRWSEERRFLLRCELDAAFFHLYLGRLEHWHEKSEALTQLFPTPREVVDYVMESFPLVKKSDTNAYGAYRTKSVILEIYDKMATAQTLGVAYQTSLSPQPADPKIAHPARVEIKPLDLPTGKRTAIAESDYMLLVALTALHVSGGEIATDRLMTACKLLALPEQLAKSGADLHGNMARQWRRRFTDTLDPKLFLPTIRALVEGGAIKLIPQGQGSRTVWVDRAAFKLEPEIEFDVRFALEVGDEISAEQLSSIPDIATIEQLRPLYSAA